MVQFYFQLDVLNRNCWLYFQLPPVSIAWHNYTPNPLVLQKWKPPICTGNSSILEYQRSILFPPWGRIGTPFQYLWCLTDISMGLLGDFSRWLWNDLGTCLVEHCKDSISHVGASCVLFLRFYDNSEKVGLGRWAFWVWFLKFHGLPSIMSRYNLQVDSNWGS